MTFLNEFSYPDIPQRRIVIFNAFVTFIALGLIYTNAAIVLKYYFLYRPVLQLILLTALFGFFFGNLAGRLVFSKVKKFRLVYITADLLFIFSGLFYLYRSVLINESNSPLITLFFYNQYYTLLPFFIISFFAGIKTCYLLKIACGDFIDGKRAVLSFLVSAIFGFTSGIALAAVFYYYNAYYFYSGILPLLALPTVFLIKLAYNPKPIYAQEIREHAPANETNNNHKRNDLFFVYLNFTYVIIYIYMAYITIVKNLGDFIHIQLLFLVTTLLSLVVGFFIAKIVKQAFWFIYAEMLYPVFFIISFVSILYYKNLSAPDAIYLFIPLSVILGFSLLHSIDHILSSRKHKNRFNIINFSVFILPVPIIASLYFIDFTYLWHFVLLYTAALLNIFIPGLYLMQTHVRGYKKMIYFVLSLIFIPLLILIHMYFKIPLNNNLYIEYTKGFDSLNLINYNSPYINNEGSVFINGIKAFFADDSGIRNMKRSLIPAMLYLGDESEEVLFIDGNRKFFRNPSISFYKNTTVLDYIPERQVDNKILTISGEQNYVLVHSDIISYFINRKTRYKIITDMPNLYDQSENFYRFSGEYYKILSKYLTENGIFIQIIDLANCRKDFFAGAVKNINKSFVKTAAFYFPEYIILMAAKSINGLNIDIKNIDNLNNILSSNQELKNIFYDGSHLLSHFFLQDINELIPLPAKDRIDPFYSFLKPETYKLNKEITDNFLNNNSGVFNLIEETESNRYKLSRLKKQQQKNNDILTKIKTVELLETNKEYEEESLLLIELKKQAEYLPELRKYLSDVLSNREDFYYNAALRFEKNKKWEDARKLYKAMLAINRNNFDANYRLGILSIILQDIPSSFEYLQYAMKLKKDDPKVLYQMGVLLVTNGKPGEALVYFEKALELNEKSASIYYYTGLSYEELGVLSKAKSFYNQALLLDPNDKNIISSINRIEDKNNKKNSEYNPREKNSNSEMELGEDMPLPVTDSALKVRIEEEKNPSTDNQNNN